MQCKGKLCLHNLYKQGLVFTRATPLWYVQTILLLLGYLSCMQACGPTQVSGTFSYHLLNQVLKALENVFHNQKYCQN